jgi:signal transduction histidine kinase
MRLRIAGDLHDELGSELSGIALVSSLLRSGAHLTAHDHERLAQVQATSLRVLQGLRDIVWYINPEHDTVGSLVARMRADVETLLGDRDCQVTVEVVDDGTRMDMERRRHLLLAFKEILHNVARHAGECAVNVRFAAAGERFTLEVADDGAGFDPALPSSGSGLGSLRRRAQRLGAELAIDSRPGGGTRVRLCTP